MMPVWKTIKVGNGPKVYDDWLGILKNNGVEVSFKEQWFDKKYFSAYEKEQDIDLVILAPSDLGFKNDAKVSTFFNWAKKVYGLELCKAEAGLQLFLQMKKDSSPEEVFIAMPPLRMDYGEEWFFVLKISKDRVDPFSSLLSQRTKTFLDEEIESNKPFVFVCPRK